MVEGVSSESDQSGRFDSIFKEFGEPQPDYLMGRKQDNSKCPNGMGCRKRICDMSCVNFIRYLRIANSEDIE